MKKKTTDVWQEYKDAYQERVKVPELKYGAGHGAGYSGFIGVDFDGTLVTEDWYGTPVWPMVERVRQWVKDGKEVWIFSARGWQKDIEDWCLKYIGCVLPISNIKERGMNEWYDDRVITVERNTGRILTNPNGVDEENRLRAENEELRASIQELLEEKGHMSSLLLKAMVKARKLLDRQPEQERMENVS